MIAEGLAPSKRRTRENTLVVFPHGARGCRLYVRQLAALISQGLPI